VRQHNDGTSEYVAIAINGSPGVPLKPGQDGCKKQFLQIIHGCEGNSPDNPENFKAGGTFFDGALTYHIDPLFLGQPASKGRNAGSVGSYEGVFNEYTVWAGVGTTRIMGPR